MHFIKKIKYFIDNKLTINSTGGTLKDALYAVYGKEGTEGFIMLGNSLRRYVLAAAVLLVAAAGCGKGQEVTPAPTASTAPEVTVSLTEP